jgi:hypothetical protein
VVVEGEDPLKIPFSGKSAGRLPGTAVLTWSESGCCQGIWIDERDEQMKISRLKTTTLNLLAKVCLVWISAECFLAQNSSLTPESLPTDPQRDVRIEYVVDARDPGKKVLAVHAQIQGLEPGEVTVAPLNPKESLLEIGNRIGNFSLHLASGGIEPIVPKRNKFQFQNDSIAPLEISYQVKAAALADLGRSSYMDEDRCLLSSWDTLLVPDTGRTFLKVSFLLPDRWKVVTLATPSAGGSYEVGGRKGAFFYLGEAVGISQRINNCELTLAIEGDWPMSSRDTLRETRNQIIYLQNVAADWKPRALFVGFLRPGAMPAKTEPTSLRRDTIFVIPPRSQNGETDDLSSLHLLLAGKLIAYFFPTSRRVPDLQEGLIAYLAMKTCLKTGGISKTEFLEKISRGLVGEAAAETDDTILERAREPRQPGSGLRQALDFFVVDLALAFEGRQNVIMIGALQEASQESGTTGGDWLQKLVGEASLAHLTGLTSDPSNDDFADLLKPFGLVLERIEIPHLNFDLSETFQVSRIQRHTKGPLLQLGDRILAVNQNPLLEPTDLLKLRGWLRAGENVTLTVERNGIVLKFQERLATTNYCRLAANGLADSDKQQKLERFLAKEVLN